MKFIISILITLIISMGIGIEHFFNESINLQSKLKSLKLKQKKLASSNKKLKQEKKLLLSKQKNIQRKMKIQRRNITNKLLIRAETKIALAPAKAVPLYGIPIIVGMTATDIHAYCEDIKEMKKFENNLFGTTENNITIDEERICGMNVKQDLQPIVEKQYYDSIDWVEKSSDSIMNNIQNKYYESKIYFQELID